MQALSTEGMETLPLAQTVKPFSKVNFWRLPDGTVRVRAYVLMERAIEGAKAGIAIDGSVSMKSAFGVKGCLGFLLPGPTQNIVSPVAQDMCAYLARKVAVDGTVAVTYWATGDGSRIEEVGTLTEVQAKQYNFAGPKKYGAGTQLLPALEFFAKRFADAPWGMYIFITDGALHDLDAVKRYTSQLAREIADGQRNELKLVLIGVGKNVDERQMQELDDLETGTSVDLWDHKLAAEMQDLSEIFAEVVDESIIVADSGLVRDAKGNVVEDYRDKGVPALLVFTLPSGAESSFTLEIAGQSVTQPLT
ncbi:MAG: VWA domain-containing protein [Ardenticatenia bacterium]|nr:VWA domain-containing protein [Ardenticatenia bacterium]